MWALVVACLALPVAAGQAFAQGREMVVEDYDDVVTALDLSVDDFSGNSGVLNSSEPGFGTTGLVRGGADASLRLSWSFANRGSVGAFTGLYWSLFGLTDAQVFNGRVVSRLRFPEHALDLDDVDRPLRAPHGPRRIEGVRVELANSRPRPVTLRLELKDVTGQGRFERFRVHPSRGPQTVNWRFRDHRRYAIIGQRDLDIHRAKILSLVVEHDRVGEAFRNPDAGSIDVRRVSLVASRAERPPRSGAAMLDLAERRACQYFLDWASRKRRSLGIPQDRSSFPDLLTVGGIGFALPAYAICAERGWITRGLARERTRAVLRVLTARGGLGPERMGRVGYRGWLYHFLGPDGRRKLNFDFPATGSDESLNTVEVSTIDTGLALIGVLAAQSYFDRRDPGEVDIRRRAQVLYDRVDWPFMLDPSSRQFYLGWKPLENRAAKPRFEIPAQSGQ